MRLIDADALMKAVEKDFEGVCVYDVPPSEAVSDIERIVDNMPTIDAEPVRHGRWIHDSNNLFGCSECMERDTMSFRRGLKNYCPNCGAKMDLEVQDD